MLSSKALRSYVEEDRNLTVVMLAAGLGQDDYLRALLDAGANRNRLTSRNKMSALDIAGRDGSLARRTNSSRRRTITGSIAPRNFSRFATGRPR